MNKKILFIPLVALLTACGGSKDNNSNGGDSTTTATIVEIDGSSTVYPITEAIAEEFQNSYKDIKVTVGESGTGGGFKKFIRNEIAITDASRPVSKKEDSALVAAGIEYYELPIAYDGLAIVVNPQNTWLESITVKELKKIWEPEAQGKITKWNQIRKEWPNEEIHLYGAGTASGTFDYFTEAIVGKAKSCRGDYTGSEDDNVLVQGIASDKLALGFFGIHYYTANKDKLKLISVDDENDSNGKGAIFPSVATVKDASYQPLSRPLFIYINAKSAEGTEVNTFVKFYLDNAAKLVPETGYIALEKTIYDLIKIRFDKKIKSSVYLNKEKTIGLRLEELFKAE